MNLPEAIEINKDTLHQYEKHLLSDQREALKLGINALIFFQRLKLLDTGEIQGNYIGETDV